MLHIYNSVTHDARALSDTYVLQRQMRKRKRKRKKRFLLLLFSDPIMRRFPTVPTLAPDVRSTRIHIHIIVRNNVSVLYKNNNTPTATRLYIMQSVKRLDVKSRRNVKPTVFPFIIILLLVVLFFIHKLTQASLELLSRVVRYFIIQYTYMYKRVQAVPTSSN